MLSTVIEDVEAAGVLVMSIVQQSRIAGMELFWARVFGTSCAETVDVYAQRLIVLEVRQNSPGRVRRQGAALL